MHKWGSIRLNVAYGSPREHSFSRLLTYETARILEYLVAEVKIFDPMALPMASNVPEDHPQVMELAHCHYGREPRLVQPRAAWRHYRRDEEPD